MSADGAMIADLDTELGKWRWSRRSNRIMLGGVFLFLLALAFLVGFDRGSSAGYRHGLADGKKPNSVVGRPPALVDELTS